MIKLTGKFFGMFFKAVFVLVVCFLFLCMNVFTIPIFIVCYVVCRLLKMKTPRFAGYALMVYPTWSDGSHPTLSKDMREIDRKANAQVKRYTPIRAWEERFFD